MRIIYDKAGRVVDIKEYEDDGIFTKQQDIDRLNRIYT